MAGSYNHVVEKDGGLSSNKRVVGMLENGGDVFEAVEEMYGMIWYLAYTKTADRDYPMTAGMRATEMVKLVEEARVYYKTGLVVSPTKRYK